MKFEKSFTSGLPKTTFLDQVEPEAFIRISNPDNKTLRQLDIPADTRFRHVYIAGASQQGKSTLLEHMIAQDMQNNEGLTLLDPKGDLAEAVLHRVPPHRIQDCVYIDIKNPIPISFMVWDTEQERQTLLADVYQTFMRFSTMASGDQWLSILRWTIYTLLAAKNSSFLDIYYFLSREDRRNELLAEVEKNNVDGQYDDIFHYWEYEYTHLKSPREGPIITRMSIFTTTPPLKKILGTPTAALDIFQAMEQRKIIIVNLMGVGRENGNLVGALLTSKIQQAAFRRQSQKRNMRIPHYLYADEFQNFQTSDFDTILSEAGGFKLSLTLANQGLYQLENRIKQSVFTNVTAARIAFHLNHEDVSNWKHLLPSDRDSPEYIEPERLATLPPYVALFKIGTNTAVLTNTPKPLPPPTTEQVENANWIKLNTLIMYGGRPATSAESSLKRPEDMATCNPPQIGQDKRYDRPNKRGEKPEVQAGSAPGNIPPHKD
jgi:hypothetical protein